MQVNFKIWIEGEQGEQLIGEGIETLLKTIDKTGSMNKAAAKLNMSYRTAWAKVKKAETRLGCTLITTQAGGAQGGGSQLTPEGHRLVDTFTQFHKAVDKKITLLFNEFFAQD